MPAELPTLSLEKLSKREASITRGLDVMNTIIENNGANLFPVPHKNAYTLEGTAKTVAIMDVGIYREMVCDTYAAVKIPEAEMRLEATRDLIRTKAVERAQTLQQLLENGYLTITDYSQALAPLREYLPEGTDALRLPGVGNTSDEVAMLRGAIVERLSGLKLKGSRRILVEALLNSLTPETEYPNKALQLAVYPQPDENGERPKLSSAINSTRPVLRGVGVDIITRRAGANSAYRLGLYAGEDDEIIGLPNSALLGKSELSNDMIGMPGNEKPDRIANKINSLKLTKKRREIISVLLGHYSRADALLSDDWLKLVEPDSPLEEAKGRFSVSLSNLRQDLKDEGIYIHGFHDGRRKKYYLSENPEPEPKPLVLKEGRAKRIRQTPKEQQPGVGESENERSRREIEQRVRDVTIGTVQKSLMEEDE